MRSAGRASRNAGKTYENCARCGRRGLHLQHPTFEWTPRYADASIVFPAGTPCCWVEEPVPAARTAHQTIHQQLTARLGPRRGDVLCWATEQERSTLEGLATPAPDTCEICQAAGLPPRGIHTQAYGFAAGAALLGVCDGCGHTLLLAEMENGAQTRDLIEVS